MYVPLRLPTFTWPMLLGWCLVGHLLTDPVTLAQEGDGDLENPKAKQVVAAPYVSAVDLVPDSIAGLLRIPNVPDACTAWDKTHIGRLMDSPAMQPFVQAQREKAESYFDSVDNRVGLRPRTLAHIASGEAVAVWLPFLNDKRRPFSMCVIADVRGLRKKADEVLEQIDTDLKAGAAQRTDLTHRGQVVRVYNTKPKPGQIKVEQIAITLDDTRIIAADRDSVVIDLLDAIAGQPKGKPISTSADFMTVRERSNEAIEKTAVNEGAVIGAQWFARPFQMGRILRETFKVDRGNQVDILKLLEKQGFDAIKAAGGSISLAGNRYDMLHRGIVLAPPTTKLPSRYEKAARMLQLLNKKKEPIPDWVDPDVASFNRLNVRMEDAFLAAETLVDDALDEKVFNEMLNDIRDDENGPQIDVRKNVLPHLDDQVILLTDNTMPAEPTSERMLIAIRVSNPQAMEEAVRKAMDVEPDATLIDGVADTRIWRVKQSESPDFEDEVFGDLFDEEDEDDKNLPLLDQWSIGVVDGGQDAAYLLFSSQPEFLVKIAKRLKENTTGGLGTLPEIKTVATAIADLGGSEPSYDRVARTKLSLRIKYELLRKGQLKESGSVLSSLLRRLFTDKDGDEPDPMQTAKLPPLSEVEPFLPDSGSFIETTSDGWATTRFLLK